ncbi:MAG TPA: hypothetical protein PLB97_10210, partial [Accumulibacter sp.]|nr:hypothetical protein [Accumulibacter sp.]
MVRAIVRSVMWGKCWQRKSSRVKKTGYPQSVIAFDEVDFVDPHPLCLDSDASGQVERGNDSEHGRGHMHVFFR